ncbi:MAG TPA: DUF3761 domain-containing protein [Steroidobacteraceae bacterium]|nr:DUF3761 domain-containing protein [Steroidobacteraceae bacterium]
MQSQLLRSLIICSALAAFGATVQSYAADGTSTATAVTCKDGTSSKGGKGACSHHGGVQKGAASAAATPAAAADYAAPSAATTAPATSAPSYSKGTSSASTTKSSATTAGAARAKCKDGTLSHSKQHRGACSHHGGVAEWLDT